MPLSAVKVNPGRVVQQVAETKRPVLLKSRGRGLAVLQSLDEYESATDELEFLRGVVQGLLDLEAGREVDVATVKKRLGLD